MIVVRKSSNFLLHSIRGRYRDCALSGGGHNGPDKTTGSSQRQADMKHRIKDAPVAQLDRAPDYESGGQRFESFRARHS